MRVDRGAFEKSLVEIERCCRDPVNGIFGPGSASWTLGREVSNFLGAGRAVLLQLAHPYVAYAIEEHSRTRADPIGRFYRTFDVVYGIVFGDLAHALRAARGTFSGHGRVTGTIKEDAGRFRAGDLYDGLDLDALTWVWATLVHTVMTVQRRVRVRVPGQLSERYVREGRTFAALFGVPADALPSSWLELDRYFEGMVASDAITVTRPARETARFLLTTPNPAARLPLRVARAVTAELLPPRLREGFGLPWGPAERLLSRSAFQAARVSRHVLPRRLQRVPAYTEALRRIAGRPGRDVVGRRVEAALLDFVGSRG